MQHRNRWMVVILVLAGLLLAACGRTGGPAKNPSPYKLEKGPADGISKVILEPKAAERIALKTEAVREEQVQRKRLVGGEVVIPAGDPGKASVRVPLNASDLESVDTTKAARILSLTDDREVSRGQFTGGAGVVEFQGPGPLQYAIQSTTHSLKAGDRVRVELPLKNSGLRKLVPHSAIVFDTKGKAWVYTNPEPLVFVRHPVTIDYIESSTPAFQPMSITADTPVEKFVEAYTGHGRAVLLDGPPAGTQIVSVGVAELYGAETGIGK